MDNWEYTQQTSPRGIRGEVSIRPYNIDHYLLGVASNHAMASSEDVALSLDELVMVRDAIDSLIKAESSKKTAVTYEANRLRLVITTPESYFRNRAYYDRWLEFSCWGRGFPIRINYNHLLTGLKELKDYGAASIPGQIVLDSRHGSVACRVLIEVSPSMIAFTLCDEQGTAMPAYEDQAKPVNLDRPQWDQFLVDAIAHIEGNAPQ
jgi:hypothetical protein